MSLLVEKISALEIGVGTGSTAELIAGRVNEFWGIDISKELIAVLNSIYEGNKRINFYCCDVCSDVSLGKKFDAIYSADTLEHIKQPKVFLILLGGI